VINNYDDDDVQASVIRGVCVCVCVCVWERERERNRGRRGRVGGGLSALEVAGVCLTSLDQP
jgi:hypothetical protein